MTHRNLYWKIFLILIALYVCGYTLYAGWQIYQYSRLTTSFFPNQITWTILKQNEEQFTPKAYYQFYFGNQSYQSETIWKTAYLNEWTAREAIDRLQHQQLPVWIDPRFPEYSTVEKTFPLKIIFHLVILWILMTYFIGLGYYLTHFKNDCVTPK